MSVWKLSVCGACGNGGRFPNLNQSISEVEDCKCPFDRLYDRIVGANTSLKVLKVPRDQCVVNLLVVEIVGSIESYFREVLSEIMMICPTAKKGASDLSVSLASALWGVHSLKCRLGFEHNSLASSDNLKSTLTKMKLIQKVEEPIATLLAEYEKLCELRHMVAHSHGLVTGKNALIVGLDKQKRAVEVRLSPTDIQAFGVLALSLCRALHQELFWTICKRWAVEWPKESSKWSKAVARARFSQIWDLFYSVKDSSNILVPNRRDKNSVRSLIEKEFKVSYSQ